MKRNEINKEVDVVSVYFGNCGQLKTFPRQIECDGNRYTFNDGLQMMVQKGQQWFKIFDMTDGQAHYRLRNDVNSRSWQLLSITQS